ncbi:MAG: efflux RND transporter periplasmic adaptor subunit [Cytophagia bacterium]|nr:efflux RND transporter periplasmic adaptor subunit [Cytophagia bacterium]
MKRFSILITLGAFIWLGCTDSSTSDSAEVTESEAKKVDNIMVGNLQVAPLIETITATGVIDVPPMERKVLHSYIAANVTYLGVIQGEPVKKGQVVAKLSHPNLIALQQQLLEEKVEIDFQTKELARKQSLVATNATSQKEINEIERALNKSKIRYETLSSQLQLLGLSAKSIEANGPVKEISIIAPFDSKVSKVMVTNGQFVNSDQPLLELLNEGHKHLELDVFAKDASKVKIGQKIEFNLPGSDETYVAEVYLINPDVDSNKLRVHGHLEDESVSLKIGTFIEAKIVVGNDEVALIENEELIREGDTFYLFQQLGDAYEKVLVSVGRSNDQFTEVLGAQNSDKWVLKGNYYLQEF